MPPSSRRTTAPRAAGSKKASPASSPATTEKRRFKIPPNALPGIYALAGEGKSLAEICAWFLATYGKSVTPTAIRKKLEKQRSERETIARAVVREHVAKTVNRDLELLELARDRLQTLVDKLWKKTERKPDQIVGFKGSKTRAQVFASVQREVVSVLKTCLELTGADKGDDRNAELLAAERALASGMSGVAARLRAAGILREPDAAGEGGTQ